MEYVCYICNMHFLSIPHCHYIPRVPLMTGNGLHCTGKDFCLLRLGPPVFHLTEVPIEGRLGRQHMADFWPLNSG